MPLAASRNRLVVAAAFLTAGTCSGVWFLRFIFTPVEAYVISWIVSSVFYVAFAVILQRTQLTNRMTLWLLSTSVLLRVLFLPIVPVGSDDFYRYIWDGKTQANGISPYHYAPNDPDLTPLASDIVPDRVNNPYLKTVYFPFTEWIFLGTYSLAGENVWGLKLINLVAEILTILALWKILSLRRRPVQLILLYALCPLTILQFSVDVHIDAVGISLLAFGYLLWNRNRHFLSILLIACSISVKPVAAVLLPFLWLETRSTSVRTQLIAVPVLVIFGQFLPYALLGDIYSGLATFARDWAYNGGIFSVIDWVVENNQVARVICGLILAGALLFVWARPRPLEERLTLSVMLLLLLSPVVHPWYVGWLLVLMPLHARRSALLFSAMVSGTGMTLLTLSEEGRWVDYAVVRTVEYLPVLVALALELKKAYIPGMTSLQKKFSTTI